MKYRPMAGMKYCLRQHEIPLWGMKYLPTEGMKEALLRNAIQIWLRLEEKLSAQLTDEVARWVHLHFMQKVTAAWNVSFKDTPTSFVSFSVKISKYSIDYYMNICSKMRSTPHFASDYEIPLRGEKSHLRWGEICLRQVKSCFAG